MISKLFVEHLVLRVQRSLLTQLQGAVAGVVYRKVEGVTEEPTLMELARAMASNVVQGLMPRESDSHFARGTVAPDALEALRAEVRAALETAPGDVDGVLKLFQARLTSVAAVFNDYNHITRLFHEIDPHVFALNFDEAVSALGYPVPGA